MANNFLVKTKINNGIFSVAGHSGLSHAHENVLNSSPKFLKVVNFIE